MCFLMNNHKVDCATMSLKNVFEFDFFPFIVVVICFVLYLLCTYILYRSSIKSVFICFFVRVFIATSCTLLINR